MDIDPIPYVLREELVGHGAAVRSLCFTGTELISGGGDAVVNRWEVSPVSSTTQGPQIFDHSHTVLALTALPPRLLEECPTGGFVSGCQDHMVRVYNSEGTLVRQLPGHSHGVVSLSFTVVPAYSADGDHQRPLLLSGSWDGTAKVWDLNPGPGQEAQCVATLPAHENGVTVLGLPNGCVATGSTGKQAAGKDEIEGCTVRVWSKDHGGDDGGDNGGGGDEDALSRGGWRQVALHVDDHQGPVRSLCLAPEGMGFVSTSNDGTARIRDLAGETLEVVSHPHSGTAENFVYAVAPLSGGAQEFVTCSEDASAAVWLPAGGAEHMQVLEHPDSVWCVCALPGGDFATGCNDGTVRLWTRDLSHAAPEAVSAAYSEAVEAAKARKKGGPSAEEVAKMPLWEQRSGQPGKSEGDVKVFNKDGTAIAAQWSASSSDWVEVGEVTGQSDGGTLDGQRFDHVLPIEFEQPGDEGTGLVTKLQIGYNNGDNPYTTAHEFIAKHGLDQDWLEKIASYIRKNTSAGANQPPTIGGGGGGNAPKKPKQSSSSSSSSESAAAAALLGVKGQYVKFDKPLSVDKILAKLTEFNGDPEVVGAALSALELDSIHQGVCAVLAVTSKWHVSTVDAKAVALVGKAVNSWPRDKVFPAVDLLRLLSLHPDGSAKLAALDQELFEVAGGGGLWRCLSLALEPGSPMALQVVCTSARSDALVHAAGALVAVPGLKNVRGAASAVLLNYANALRAEEDQGGVAGPSSGALFFDSVAGAVAAAAAANASEISDEPTLIACLQAAVASLDAKSSDVPSFKGSRLPGALASLQTSGNCGGGQRSELVSALVKHLLGVLA